MEPLELLLVRQHTTALVREAQAGRLAAAALAASDPRRRRPVQSAARALPALLTGRRAVTRLRRPAPAASLASGAQVCCA